MLAHGKSFRSHKFRQLVREGESSLTLFCEIEEAGVSSRLGVQKSLSGETKIRIDGESVSSSAQLAQKVPLLVLTTSSFSLLEGSPKVRRQFFDWIVFHVEHEFVELWKSYTRCLKQRNTMLRHDKISYDAVRPWDVEIGRLAKRIDDMRLSVFAQFNELLQALAEHYAFGSKVSLDYVSGWPNRPDSDYEQVLRACFERDSKLGYTQHGCHRSDIKIRYGRAAAVDILSRGQQKLLITALYLSAAKFFIRQTERRPLFLIDDFAAELDEFNIQLLLEQVSQLGSQVFLTAVEESIALKFCSAIDLKPTMFHVEHGKLLDH